MVGAEEVPGEEAREVLDCAEGLVAADCLGVSIMRLLCLRMLRVMLRLRFTYELLRRTSGSGPQPGGIQARRPPCC